MEAILSREHTLNRSPSHSAARQFPMMSQTFVMVGLKTKAEAWTGKEFSFRTDGEYQKTKTTGHYVAIQNEESLFTRLVEQWHVERGITSSLSDMIVCPSYLRIIAIGERALPLILNQLRREGDDPDHWFAALEAITGEDPVPENAYGDTVTIAKAWLLWAEENVW